MAVDTAEAAVTTLRAMAQRYFGYQGTVVRQQARLISSGQSATTDHRNEEANDRYEATNL